MLDELVDVSVGGEEIRAVLRTDGELFIETFLADKLESPVPRFHTEIWQLLTNTSLTQVLLAVPRGHAKTTLAKLCVVWYMLYTKHRFCVYVSNTNTIALNACKDIIEFIESDNFRAIFGPAKIITANTTHSLWVFELTQADGTKKRCTLRALGANQQVRGINVDNQRPDIAVVDDLEDLDNTETESAQKKLDLWVFGPFIKALAKNHKIVWLGNMIRDTCLLARLAKNPDWNPVVFGSIVKNPETGSVEPLWPYLWSFERLMKDYQNYKAMGLQATWLCEMMNMAGHLVNGFGPESLNYQPVPPLDSFVATFITVDPAFTENPTNDESAVVVHGITEDGACMVVDYWHGRVDENVLFYRIYELATKWRAWTWGIESIAAQRVLMSLFKLLLVPTNMHNRVLMIPLISGKANSKYGRIRAWASLMGSASPTYAIPDWDVDIASQLMAYDPATTQNRDDLIDACAYGPIMLSGFLALLTNHYQDVMANPPKAQTEKDYANV